MRSFTFIDLGPLQINEEFYPLLKESSLLAKLPLIENHLSDLELTFYHRKQYRVVRAFKVGSKEIYIKSYLKNFEEAESEWINIQRFWQMGFPTSVPVLFFKDDTHRLIGTERVRGENFINLIKPERSRLCEIVSLISDYLGRLHKTGLYHQDCYLNHFYIDENNTVHLIDLPRVVYIPKRSFYNQVKDLSQLRFSFSKYLAGLNWHNLWNIFVESYERSLGEKLDILKKIAIKLKFTQIKRHTEKRVQ